MDNSNFQQSEQSQSCQEILESQAYYGDINVDQVREIKKEEATQNTTLKNYLLAKDKILNLYLEQKKSVFYENNQKEIFLIGRDTASDFVINSQEVSSKHAEIIYNNFEKEYYIKDCSSLGTYKRMKEIQLQQHLVFRFGRSLDLYQIIQISQNNNKIIIDLDNFQVGKFNQKIKSQIQIDQTGNKPYVIGRNATCDKQLNDPSISGAHATIHIFKEENSPLVILKDNSTYGTFFKLQKGQCDLITNCDEYLIGSQLFKAELSDAVMKEQIIQEDQQSKQQLVCKICYQNRIQAILKPCGHPMCLNDIVEIMNKKKICPFCREIIVNYTIIEK